MKTYNIFYFYIDSVDNMMHWDGLQAEDTSEAFILFHRKMKNTFNLTYKEFRIYNIVEECE